MDSRSIRDSVLVPMTMSDLERRDAMGQIFLAISIITTKLFDLQQQNMER